MSEKKIILSLGGKFGFNVKKTFADGLERFEVSMEDLTYGGRCSIAGASPWAEAMDALNAFREEAAEVAEALVQIATLTATGQQEDDVPGNYVTTK